MILLVRLESAGLLGAGPPGTSFSFQLQCKWTLKQGFNINTPERSVDYAIAGYSTGSSITCMSKTREVIKANQDITPILPVNRKILLDTLIKHETLTEDDIAKEENLGVVPNKEQLGFLLSELHLSGHIQVLSGAVPVTYSITPKGIDEGKRLEPGTD